MPAYDRESILIIEEEKILALDLLRRLERFGYEVVGMALDPAEARAIAATSFSCAW